MKLFKILFLLILFSVSACSDDDADSNTTFTADGTAYLVTPLSGMVRTDTQFEFSGKTYLRTTMTVVGLAGFNSAVMNFDTYRDVGAEVTGTYAILDDFESTSQDNVLDYVDLNSRGCAGWTTLLGITDANTGVTTNFNNPASPSEVTIIDNGNNSYTVQFNGTIRQYDSALQAIGSIPVSMNITSTIQ